MIIFYHQTKILISFWYKRRLNLKYFIQLLETYFSKKKKKKSEILPVKLTRTHISNYFLDIPYHCILFTLSFISYLNIKWNKVFFTTCWQPKIVIKSIINNRYRLKWWKITWIMKKKKYYTWKYIIIFYVHIQKKYKIVMLFKTFYIYRHS